MKWLMSYLATRIWNSSSWKCCYHLFWNWQPEVFPKEQLFIFDNSFRLNLPISLTRLFRIQVTSSLSYDPPFKRVKGCLSNTKLYVILHNLGFETRNVGWNAINCLIIGWSVCRLKESLTDGKIIFFTKSWFKLAFVVGSWSVTLPPN